MTPIRENVYAVGAGNSLVAAVAEPARKAGAGEAPAIVILNTGIVHRVGHQRKFVVLARLLAARGLTVVRFDFAGIGDSDARQDDLPPLEGCLDDIRVVLDWLETTRGLRRFVLLGLCSGADHAIIYAGGDPRVVGAVLLDPMIPSTSRYLLHYFARRLVRPSSWLNFVTGHGRLYALIRKRLMKTKGGEDLDAPMADDERVREFLNGVYARAVDNNVQLLAVLTGATDGRQSYREQILDAFPELPLGPLLRAEFLRDCDHLFLFECDRERLNAIVVDWIETTSFRDAEDGLGKPVPSQAATFVKSMAGTIAMFGGQVI
ncbi:MAG: alpha/beta fold hydrolase [Hyphomicrobiaceae bacterium]|nr:alpha/beta fold hydrolase [Hyphomicrobiaceae bacterium]